MPSVVGVAFKPVTKVYYFDPAGFNDLEVGEDVLVDTSRGRTLGRVVTAIREVPDTDISGTLKPVVRRATAWDMVQQDQANHREDETLQICRDRARALKLDMKIVEIEWNYDGSSVLVYFTADQRVDFRNLVHELAQQLRTRVEMRQIGVRDAAKFQGGCGRCGLSLCCASWLREFTPVSIKMAKQQDLPLNPAEISGACGRLLCCLSYEDEAYGEMRRSLPRVNSTVMTPEGPGKVRQVHVLRRTVTVLVQGPNEEKTFIEVPIPEGGLEGQGEAGCPNCPKQARAGGEADQPDVDDLPEAASPLAELDDPEGLGEIADDEPRRGGPTGRPAGGPPNQGRSRPKRRR